MIAFAVKCIDWGTGIIPVPTIWREIVGNPSIVPNPDELAQSVETNISPKTATDPVRLLYRHSFVSLFNHLERIEDLRSIGAVTVADLKPIVWLSKQLNDWGYHSGSISPFRGALEEGYKRGKLIKPLYSLRQSRQS